MLLLDTQISFWTSLLETINHWDQLLLLKINGVWTSDFLNNFFPWWRDSNTSIPLYLFLMLFAFMNFGWRIWPWIVFFILTIVLCDQVSSTFIKNLVQRPRPCNNDEIKLYVNALLGYCSNSYSFPSSHATNHFGMAFYIYFTMKPVFKKWGYLLFVWAASICYGQMYIGIHYPADVLAGALIGTILGLMTASIFNRRVGLPPLINCPETTTATSRV